MKFSLAIYSSPEQNSSAHTALDFAEELLCQGHHIYRLFFFNDGVLNCADTNNTVNRAWQKLINTQQLDAIVCIASAQKRGLDHSKDTADWPSKNIHSAFSAGGIAQLIDATVQSDRIISFGGGQ